MRPAAHPAPELVELAEAEAVRVLHHHHGGVGHVHLKTADLSCDAALLKEAQEAAEALLAADPALKDHPLTAQRVEELFAAGGDALN